MADIILEKLNEAQIEAVTYCQGPLFVVAGAGTGKTRTLTNRVAYLFRAGIKPEEMLVLTFTNRAAQEMAQRVSYLLKQNVFFPYMATFHSFAFKFLKEHIGVLNSSFTVDFAIADEYDARKIIKEIIDNKKIITPLEVRDIYKYLSAYKSGFGLKHKIIDEIYPHYQQELLTNNLLDFDDLLIFTRNILRANNEIRSFYMQQFKHILVDEFQDTDKIQYEILTLLSRPDKNIFVVGDPDQSIYSFRGASYENNDNFVRDFKAKVITLNKNYRSVNNILKAANKLITYNQKRSPACADKKLVSDYPDGSPLIYRRFKNDLIEAEKTAESINYLINGQGLKPSQIAILVRANYLSRSFEQALLKHKIPYIIYGGVEFYKRKEIKDFLAYLKVILNPHLDYYLSRIINFPKRGIGDKLLTNLKTHAASNHTSLFDAIASFSLKGQSTLLSFKEIITSLQKELPHQDNLGALIDLIGLYSGYYQYLLLQAGFSEIDDWSKETFFENLKESLAYANLDQLKNVINLHAKSYANLALPVALNNILNDLELLTNNELALDGDEQKVVISTYHQIKGLEFDTVFMPAMEEEIIPNSIIKHGSDDEMEEERRIAYVGITRAKMRLIISSCEQRFRFGGAKFYPPSRFINEMKISEEVIKNVTANNTSYIGAKVYHPHFKEGIIIQENNNILTIIFKDSSVGQKKILKNFPGLEIFTKD